MVEDTLISNDDIRRVEAITGVADRRYWPAHEKLRIIEESLVPREPVSAAARRNGVAPNLLFQWRGHMDEGGAVAIGSNRPVVRSRWFAGPRHHEAGEVSTSAVEEVTHPASHHVGALL